ncbi:MAG: hypothetical protein IJ733_09025 [Lachnospiraceae bacterium]|nr:hypothetical protein [Lachnospiraceae bacterium]
MQSEKPDRRWISKCRNNSGAVPKRARYYSSLINGNCLEAGKDYNKLPESWMIFITENDVLEGNLPIYHIERTIVETRQNFDDKAHIIYVNGAIEEDTPLGKLVHDFKCKEPDELKIMEIPYLSGHFCIVSATYFCEVCQVFYSNEVRYSPLASLFWQERRTSAYFPSICLENTDFLQLLFMFLIYTTVRQKVDKMNRMVKRGYKI